MATPLQLAANSVTVRYGREFCSYGLRNNISCIPVDDVRTILCYAPQFSLNFEQVEIERSNEHEAHLIEAPILVPFPPDGVESPQVLDLGSGTGIWCSKVLDDHENGECEACVTHTPWRFRRAANVPQITGIDIFDCDKDFVDASEYNKLSHDLNEPLSRSGLRRDVFHLINSRCLANGINTGRWPSLVEECWELLVPGGWLQMVEPLWVFQSGKSRNLPCLMAWQVHYANAQERMGRNPRVDSNLLFGCMSKAGFGRIKSETREVPAAGWKDGMFDLIRMPFLGRIRG